jgi:hypothetical protein
MIEQPWLTKTALVTTKKKDKNAAFLIYALRTIFGMFPFSRTAIQDYCGYHNSFLPV